MSESSSPFTFSTSMDAATSLVTPEEPRTPESQPARDNFGDEATATPRASETPSENEQLRRRHLNSRGLPERETDSEPVHKLDEALLEETSNVASSKLQIPPAMGTRTRSRNGMEDAGSGMNMSMSERMKEKLRSPLLKNGTLQLEELREQFSKNVEVQ
jgi:hypothetical protein